MKKTKYTFHRNQLWDFITRLPSSVRRNENQGREYLASMGISMFSQKSFEKCLKKIQVMILGRNLILILSTGYSTLSYQYTGYWTDIGNYRFFLRSEYGSTTKFLNLICSVLPVYTRARMLPPLKINGSFVIKLFWGWLYYYRQK